MAYVREGYVCVKKGRGRLANYKNWFLIKHGYNVKGDTGFLFLKTMSFPKYYVGKKIRLKVEVIKETN